MSRVGYWKRARAPRLAASTRAIRRALVVSAAALALSGSGVAFAGVCGVTGLDEVSCNGVFTDTVTNAFPPVPDLTLVLGNFAPTSVTPVAGSVGVDASWGGQATVISYADITTTDADGVHMLSADGTATLYNYGEITTHVAAAAQEGASIGGLYGAYASNGGSIIADAYAGADYGVTALYGYSALGNVVVVNQEGGSISGTGDGGQGVGIYAHSYGASIVSNDGTVSGNSSGGAGLGIVAYAVFGPAAIGNGGSVEAYSETGHSLAVDAISVFYDASVDNSGTISANSGDYAGGALAVSLYANASIDNTGSIDANSSASDAYGAVASAKYGGDVTVVNGADAQIQATSTLTAHGIVAIAAQGDASVQNYGYVGAISAFYPAYGVSITAGGEASLVVGGDGEIHASSYWYAFGAGVTGSDASVANAGTISAYSSNYGAQALALYASTGTATLHNDGTIEAEGGSSAYGALVLGNSADAVAYNTGEISAEGNSHASALEVTSRGDTASVDNSGTVHASAYYASTGILANGYDAIYVDNSGEVSVDSVTGAAVALDAYGTGAFTYIQVDNSGTLTAISDSGSVAGIGASSVFNSGQVSVDNSGTIGAYSEFGASSGIFAGSGNGQASVENGGLIRSESDYSSAYGIRVSAFLGYGSASNTGDIYVYAGRDATGMILSSFAGDLYAYNDGAIVVDGDSARGIVAYSGSGAVDVVNLGGIEVHAGSSSATGINAATFGDYATSVYNLGNVLADSQSGSATGIYAGGFQNDISVVNDGQVSADGYALGIGVEIKSFGGDSYVHNGGSIHASANGDAYGLELWNYNNPGSASIDNTGTIAASSVYGDAFAVHTSTFLGDFYLYNEEALSADSVFGSAYGVRAYVTGETSTAGVVNVGSIDATSTDGDATGVWLKTQGTYGTIDLDNSGTISAQAGDAAVGVYLNARGFYGEATAYNDGSIEAIGDSYGIGVRVISGGKYAAFENNGDIYALAVNEGPYGNAVALGAGVTSFYGDSQLHNSGMIAAIGDGGDFGYGVAVGAFAQIYGGNSLLDNSGTVSAEATGYFGGTATGVRATSALLSATVYNSGSVSAESSGGFIGRATGAYVFSSESASVLTAADSSISAQASGYYGAFAFGARISGVFANAYGEGAISASAIADAEVGNARAYGVHLYGSFTGLYNLGDGAISASAEGSYALAVGAFQDGYFTAFHNEGDIHAFASGDTGAAVGAMTLSYYTVRQYNDGDIGAIAEGEELRAVGLFAYSRYSDANLYNSGTITASADYLAVGVQLKSYYGTYVYNDGLIAASGADANVAIFASGESADSISNHGTIAGALWLGEGDDYLYNAEGAVWNVGTTPTDFGAGDDAIVNYGTINMTNSVIHMGTYSAEGNSFSNYSLVRVRGENWIDMGGPQALVPALNPLAFYNSGTLDFQDGSPDDYLLVTGDFGGDGDINVDVSGLQGASDQLYIDGSVVSGTVGTINVDLVDLPEEIETLVPMVYVTGNSVAGNFVLGDVDWDELNSFVTLDFNLVADIDASNATPDVFALGIEVSGLSDPGTLAAAVPGAVQGLMNSQVGTWRQRMGVIDGFVGDGLSLWARVWTDKGGFSPDHHASNFGDGGNFAWEQKNSGVEAGLDFEVTDEFFVGLLVGKSQADVGLDDPGHGSADLDADTWGIYGTWISPTGFYLDASYRWMSFDVDLDSVAGPMQVNGDAESFNLELGYAWTLKGGLQIEPQLQYTKTNVDSLDVLTTSSGIEFASDGGESSRGRVGVALRQSFGRIDDWLWTPYATLSAVREFDGENRYAINDSFFGETDLEGTSALLEIGFTARHQNWSIYGGLNWQDGGAVENFFGGQLGVRYSFGAPPPAPVPMTAAPAKTCAELDDDGDGIDNCSDKCTSADGESVGADGCAVPTPPPEPAIEPKPYRG